ncbi:MAG TPA: hypothetical protein VN106_08820 [Sphingomicrobium sp.]|jgi:hypothetical protein|nr:hypothetical protein [Sphingomicrobium sp.]
MIHALKSCLKASAGLCLGLGALGFATSASACGMSLSRQPAAYQVSPTSGLLHQASEDNPGNHAIVGMWSVKFAATGYSDFGYVQWHSDGTEFMNSGGRAPSTQNFCMGVWKQVAPSRYHLLHLAISYDPSGVHNANVVIKEDVTLNAAGNGYSGPFTIDVYNPDTNAVLQHVAGRVTGTRILPN